MFSSIICPVDFSDHSIAHCATPWLLPGTAADG